MVAHSRSEMGLQSRHNEPLELMNVHCWEVHSTRSIPNARSVGRPRRVTLIAPIGDHKIVFKHMTVWRHGPRKLFGESVVRHSRGLGNRCAGRWPSATYAHETALYSWLPDLILEAWNTTPSTPIR